MKKRSTILALSLWFAVTGLALAQGSTDYGAGLKVDLNENKSKYIRFLVWNQIWFRHSQMNPGTSINGDVVTSQTDISSRRLRILAYAQVSKRYMVLSHVGINNQTFINGGASGSGGTGGYGAGKKPGIFFHDAWNG